MSSSETHNTSHSDALLLGSYKTCLEALNKLDDLEAEKNNDILDALTEQAKGQHLTNDVFRDYNIDREKSSELFMTLFEEHFKDQ
ncbi:hypothetical protein CPC08DRAFT_764899 [Agrocybe pediades]|nr:hypothetical protein CPC08DRAFT_764899 [Agrocybe pediades]